MGDFGICTGLCVFVLIRSTRPLVRIVAVRSGIGCYAYESFTGAAPAFCRSSSPNPPLDFSARDVVEVRKDLLVSIDDCNFSDLNIDIFTAEGQQGSVNRGPDKEWS